MCVNTRWFKYDRDDVCVSKSQLVPVIFEPPCIKTVTLVPSARRPGAQSLTVVLLTVSLTFKPFYSLIYSKYLTQNTIHHVDFSDPLQLI
jgi:hypothetical protein